MDSLASIERLADVLPDGLLVVDADGVIVAANAALATMLGADRAALIGQPVETLVPARVRALHERHRLAFTQHPSARPMGTGLELMAQRADGSEVPVDISLGGVTVEGQDLVIATVRDVTTQRQLERNNAYLDVISDSTRSAVIVVGADRTIVGVNLSAERLLGVRRDHLQGVPVAASILAASPEISEALRLGETGHHVEDRRMLLTSGHGEQTPVSVTTRPIRDQRRSIIGVSLLLFDLTEREASQDALASLQAQLEVMERLGGLGTWEYDAVTGEFQMSPGLHELVEVSPLEFGGMLSDFLPFLAVESAEQFRAGLERCVAGVEELSMECELRDGDGPARWISISGSRAEGFDPTGHARARGIVQDLTGAHQAIESLLLADELKDRFLATVSHELRTPLTVIVGFADYLRATADDVTASYLDAMHRNAQEMDLMVDQLLDLSRVQAGRVGHTPEPHPLRQLVDDVVRYAHLPLAGHAVRNETTNVSVTVDELGFRRILANLLVNAAKFSNTGTEIVIESTVEDDHAVVTVSDQGVGIAEDESESIFEQFNQARQGRPTQVRGTGVGLAIVRRYVELHGGRVWVESELGVGSKFRFTIPLTPAEAAEGATPDPADRLP